jgi:hypothetical protein
MANGGALTIVRKHQEPTGDHHPGTLGDRVPESRATVGRAGGGEIKTQRRGCLSKVRWKVDGEDLAVGNLLGQCDRPWRKPTCGAWTTGGAGSQKWFPPTCPPVVQVGATGLSEAKGLWNLQVMSLNFRPSTL